MAEMILFPVDGSRLSSLHLHDAQAEHLLDQIFVE